MIPGVYSIENYITRMAVKLTDHMQPATELFSDFQAFIASHVLPPNLRYDLFQRTSNVTLSGSVNKKRTESTRIYLRRIKNTRNGDCVLVLVSGMFLGINHHWLRWKTILDLQTRINHNLNLFY